MKAFTAPLAGLLGLAVLGAGAHASDDGDRGDRRYEVTITNLTRGQIFSPPLVVTHPDGIALFEAGEPASDGLATLAEDGDSGPLSAALSGIPGVRVAAAGGPVLPGGSITVEVGADSPRAVLSVAGMLVVTNDAFFAVDGAPLPRSRRDLVEESARAYDAGSEDNDERCAYIPGPPCGSAFQSSGVPGEGYVHVHAGIHGIGDLAPADHDWRNPVARVTVHRVD